MTGGAKSSKWPLSETISRGRGWRFPFAGAAFRSASRTRDTFTLSIWPGVALGMWVVWSLEEDPWGRGVQVTIAHDLTYPLPFLNGWFARNMVGDQFVHAIAGRTLATIKATVENDGVF